MSWDGFSIAIGSMLNDDGFAFHPGKSIHTKMIGKLNVVVDIAKEAVYFFDGADESTEDPDGILADIRKNITDMVGSQIVQNVHDNAKIAGALNQGEPPVQKGTPQLDPELEEYIKETATLSDGDPAKVTREMLAAPPNVPVVRESAQALTPLVTGVVRPMVTASEAMDVWNEFQSLKRAVLEPKDLAQISGKDYVKKSGWRKLASAFNLNDKIVEEVQTPHTDGQGWTWKIKVLCTAPNGRTCEGVGMCSTDERKFSHLEHDTYSTAHTRAKNRAISDMIAAGEVSAEEVST